MRVVFCTPTVTRPHDAFLGALEASVPLLDAAGIEHRMVNEVGSPYISAARATMLRKALDAKADAVVFIDHDLSWHAEDLVRLIEAPYEVVGGTYRFKKDEIEYMGRGFEEVAQMAAGDRKPVAAQWMPAGFLKVTSRAVDHFMHSYPQLCYGPLYNQAVDLFNHGAHGGMWWGEDYAFCRNWAACGGKVMCVPDLSITHHSAGKAYPGNFFEFMCEA